MTNIRTLVQGMIEKASAPLDGNAGDPSVFDSVVNELVRANKLLDANAEQKMFELLDIRSVEDAIRATKAYTRSFLLGQQLSLATLQNVCKELMQVTERYKVSPPQCWSDIYSGDFRMEEVYADLEEDDEEERYRANM